MCVEVRDTGIGIPETKRAGLFKPFSQPDSSTTREYGGTGLGPVIVHRLALLMGGDLRCDSRPGGGATFTFEADLVEAPLPAAPPFRPLPA